MVHRFVLLWFNAKVFMCCKAEHLNLVFLVLQGIYLATVLYERPMGDPQLFGDVELKLRFVPGKNWQARPSLRHFIKIQQTSKSCMDRDSMRLDAAFAFAGLLALAGLCFCWLYGQQLLHSCTICTHAGQLRAPFWWRPLFVLLPLRWEHTMRKPTPRLGELHHSISCASFDAIMLFAVDSLNLSRLCNAYAETLGCTLTSLCTFFSLVTQLA